MVNVNDSLPLLAVGLLNIGFALVLAGIRARSEAAQAALTSGEVLAELQQDMAPTPEYAGSLPLQAN